MKVIDLLNKIANGEEVPNKIKVGMFELTLSDDGKHYIGETLTILNDVYGMHSLNDEIEIIEEDNHIVVSGTRKEVWEAVIFKDNHIVVLRDKTKHIWKDFKKEFNNGLAHIIEVWEFDKLVWKREEVLDEVEKKYNIGRE